MNKRRLLKLAAFLRTVPRRAFDIGDWQTKAATKPEGKVPGECGFAGCAMGWAAHAKLFRGFKLEGPLDFPYYYTRDGGVLNGFTAINALFDFEHAEQLFLGTYYDDCNMNPTPLRVAKRIEHLVKTGQIK